MAQQASLVAKGLGALVLAFIVIVLVECLGQWNYQPTDQCNPPDSDATALFDYIGFYYCSDMMPNVVKTLALLCWLVLVIMLLASTADHYFVPILEKLSNDMGLSEEVAGITLLALGNGMPDLMTATSSISHADDFDLVMGDIFGAACFLPTIVLGAVLLCSPGRTIAEPRTFLLINCTYLIEISFIFGITWDSSISIVESAGFFVFYGIYVILVVSLGNYLRKRGLASVVKVSVASDVGSVVVQEGLEKGLKAVLDKPSTDTDPLLGLSTQEIAGPFGWMQYVMELPFSVLRHISIPAANWDWKRRALSALCPLCAAVVCPIGFVGTWESVAANVWILPVWSWALIIGSIGAALVLLCSTAECKPCWHNLLVVLGLVSTIAWFNIIANECVAILETFGLALNISSDILGITVLAWGNCVGDLVADMAMARQGKAKMAVAGVFGSLIFNDCLGLGTAITSYTATRGSLPAALSLNNKIAAAVVVSSVLTTTVYFAICRFSCPRWFSMILFVEYVGFMIASVCLALND